MTAAAHAFASLVAELHPAPADAEARRSNTPAQALLEGVERSTVERWLSLARRWRAGGASPFWVGRRLALALRRESIDAVSDRDARQCAGVTAALVLASSHAEENRWTFVSLRPTTRRLLHVPTAQESLLQLRGRYAFAQLLVHSLADSFLRALDTSSVCALHASVGEAVLLVPTAAARVQSVISQLEAELGLVAPRLALEADWAPVTVEELLGGPFPPEKQRRRAPRHAEIERAPSPVGPLDLDAGTLGELGGDALADVCVSDFADLGPSRSREGTLPVWYHPGASPSRSVAVRLAAEDLVGPPVRPIPAYASVPLARLARERGDIALLRMDADAFGALMRRPGGLVEFVRVSRLAERFFRFRVLELVRSAQAGAETGESAPFVLYSAPDDIIAAGPSASLSALAAGGAAEYAGLFCGTLSAATAALGPQTTAADLAATALQKLGAAKAAAAARAGS